MLRNHEIVFIFKTLSEDDIDAIRSMLESKFFNNRKIVNKMFEAIVKFHPDYTSLSFTEENIANMISQSKSYDKSTFRATLSFILKTVEKYLVLKQLDQDPFYENYLLIKSHFCNNRLKLIGKVVKENEIILKNDDNSGVDKYLYHFKLTVMELNYLFSEGQINKPGKNKIIFDKFLNVFTYLINYFVNELIDTHMTMRMYAYTKPPSNINNKIESIIASLHIEDAAQILRKDNEFSHIIEIKMNMLNAFSNIHDTKRYYVFKDSLIKYSPKLFNHELCAYYNQLLSYCYLKSTDRDSNKLFSMELFLMGDMFLKNKYYITEKLSALSIRLFKMLLFAAIDNNKIEWAAQYLEKYYSETNQEYHADAYNFGAACLSFCRGDYLQSLELISKVTYDAFLNDLRQLKLLNFYKLGFIPQAKQEIRAFRKYLRLNKTMTSNLKEDIKIFLEHLEQLIKAEDNTFLIKKQIGLIEEKEKHFRYKALFLRVIKEAGSKLPALKLNYS